MDSFYKNKQEGSTLQMLSAKGNFVLIKSIDTRKSRKIAH